MVSTNTAKKTRRAQIMTPVALLSLLLWPALPASAQSSPARIGAKTQTKVEVMPLFPEEKVTVVPQDGAIVAIGGHNSTATNKILVNLALQKAAALPLSPDKSAFDLPAQELAALKKKVKILYCAQASALGEAEKRKDAASMFAAAGLDPAAVTFLDKKVDASFAFADYDLIYFGGGDQNRLKESFSDEAIANLHRYLDHGGIISGTSAGAAILSKHMIAGGVSHQDGTLAPDVVQMATGFGFLERMPVDMHLFQFQRFARAMAVLALDPRFADGNVHPGGTDVVVMALGQDSAALIQAVKNDREAPNDKDAAATASKEGHRQPTGAAKVTIFGTTQTWLYQRDSAFQSNLQERKGAHALADAWNMKLSVISPGSAFLVKW